MVKWDEDRTLGGKPLGKTKRIVRILQYVALIGILAYLVHFLFFTRTGVKLTHSNVRQMAEYLRSFGVYAAVFGMLAVLLQTIVPFVPFVMIAGANVLVFGLWTGFAINYSMSVSGAVLAFLFSRYFAHDWVEKKISRYPLVAKFNERLEKNGFFFILAGRLVPVVPSSAINFGSGVTKISFRHFFLGTCLGKLPMVFLESLIGYDLLHFRKNRYRLLLLLAIFFALMYIGSLFKKKLTGKNGPGRTASDADDGYFVRREE